MPNVMLGNVFCPCGVGTAADKQIITNVLHGIKVICQYCGKPIDWEAAITQQISRNSFTDPFAPLGEKIISFDITATAGEIFKGDVRDHGVPGDARLLRIGFTPKPENSEEGVLIPLDVFSNASRRAFAGPAFAVFPMPAGPKPPGTCVFAVRVSWLPPSNNNAALVSLEAAFSAFSDGRIEEAIVPANVAVESALAHFIKDFLAKQEIGKDYIKEFLSKAATYAHQLNVVLPMIVRMRSTPPMTEALRGKLNRLRKLRNSIGHSGTLDDRVTRDEIAGLLSAALFGLYYVEMIREQEFEDRTAT